MRFSFFFCGCNQLKSFHISDAKIRVIVTKTAFLLCLWWESTKDSIMKTQQPTDHGIGHHHHGSVSKNLGIAFFLNLGFALIEIVGGVLTNSVAIISDAVHDFGDALSIGISYWLERYSKKGRTVTFTYGYKRFSLLGALLNSLILFGGSVFVFAQAIPRLFAPQEVNSSGMMWLAIAGVAINGFAALKLMRGESLNQRAVMLHLLEDVLGWVAVLVGSFVIRWTGWLFIDPLLSMAIGLFILVNVVRNLVAIFRILLQAAPREVAGDQLRQSLETIPGVTEVHDFHLWSLDGEHNVASVHLVVEDALQREQIVAVKHEAKHRLAELSVDHLTVEIEFSREECRACPLSEEALNCSQ